MDSALLASLSASSTPVSRYLAPAAIAWPKDWKLLFSDMIGCYFSLREVSKCERLSASRRSCGTVRTKNPFFWRFASERYIAVAASWSALPSPIHCAHLELPERQRKEI